MILLLSVGLVFVLFYLVVKKETNNNPFSILMGSLLGLVGGFILYSGLSLFALAGYQQVKTESVNIVSLVKIPKGFYYYREVEKNIYKEEIRKTSNTLVREDSIFNSKLEWKVFENKTPKLLFPFCYTPRFLERNHTLVIPKNYLDRTVFNKPIYTPKAVEPKTNA